MGIVRSLKQTRLTIEQLRSFKGLENLSDETAMEIIDSLEKLSLITLEIFQAQKKIDQSESYMNKAA